MNEEMLNLVKEHTKTVNEYKEAEVDLCRRKLTADTENRKERLKDREIVKLWAQVKRWEYEDLQSVGFTAEESFIIIARTI